ncbi:MAG: hypothetical protein ACM31H_01140 [Nitrososphaerales archaeon]|jgi:hypothetical protein|nr:hypothetical protein [Nitrososphaeraceae archaeon]
MNKKLFILAFLIASIASSFGIVQTSPSSVAMAQSDQNNNMTDNKVSNMTDQLSMEGEILHDR